MSPDPPARDHQAENLRLFDQVAPSYDRLGFLALAAQFVSRQVAAPPGTHVLEVGSGTGLVALELAQQVGSDGQVIGVDLSPQMVALAREKAGGIPWVSFHVTDAAALPYPDQSFDLVVSVSTLFYVPDMLAALREWRRVLRPGGRVVFSSFGRGLLGPLPGLWRKRLETVGVRPGAPPLGRLPIPEAAHDLLAQAGYEGLHCKRHDLEYLIPSTGARWAEIEAGLEGAPLRFLPQRVQEQVKVEHLRELQRLFGADAMTVPVPVILASGSAPQ